MIPNKKPVSKIKIFYYESEGRSLELKQLHIVDVKTKKTNKKKQRKNERIRMALKVCSLFLSPSSPLENNNPQNSYIFIIDISDNTFI